MVALIVLVIILIFLVVFICLIPYFRVSYTRDTMKSFLYKI